MDAVATIAASAVEAPASDQATPTPEPASPEPVAVPLEEPEPAHSVPVEEPEQVQKEAEQATGASPEATATAATAVATHSVPTDTSFSQGAAAAPPTHQLVRDLTQKVSPDLADTTKPIGRPVETVAKTVDRVEPTGHLDTQSQGGLSGVGFGASPPGAIPAAPSLPRPGSRQAERDTSLDGLFMQRPVEFGGLETLWRPLPLSGASGSSTGDLRLVPAAAVAAAGGSSVVERFANPAPPGGDRPPPPPGSPLQTQLGASGTGSSPFVPIAALLALLALAAPAIFRRLGELADFRAPTPFVCALERPG
jgi:hypothetical protein